MGRTCGEPDEIGLTAVGVKLNGSRGVHDWISSAGDTDAVTSRLYLKESGKIMYYFEIVREHANGQFDFVWLPARVEGPHVGPQHVWGLTA